MLINEYAKNGNRNWDHGRPESEKKARRRRVERFLDFAESQGALIIRLVRQYHYDQFISSLRLDGVSDATIYKHQIALREFVRRWRLPLKIRPSVNRLKEKRFARLERALESMNDLTPHMRLQVAKIMEDIF